MAKKEKEPKPIITVAKVEPREITQELQDSYLDYAMSVIVSRALPDVRDGLKPVQRRILWTMWDNGVTASAKLRKSAYTVGEVMGKYHPHGDMSIYETMVRMAQDFSLRYPLIYAQGNWGSIDGDPAAAQRYTECKMAKIAEELLLDIEKETVDWQNTYDASRLEPKYLPAKLPNLLLNGAVGIAVGMATNIPPHNLNEVVDAISHLIENPKAESIDLMSFIQGPDFPTGGIIYDKKAIAQAYVTGRGSFTARGVAEISDDRIVITQIPYQVNKAELIIKIADLVNTKRIEGIRDVRDESDKDISVVIELKKDAVPQKILNQLYQYTDLQKDYHLNMLALADGIQPQVMSVKDVLAAYIEHRKNIVRRRAEFDLKKAKERAHILIGLSKALDIIDQIIKTIRKSADKDEAFKKLVKDFGFSELQATAILEMRLQTLAALERQKIEDELAEKKKIIAELESLLKSAAKILSVIRTELKEIKEKYGDERKTRVVAGGLKEFNEEDLVPAEEIILTLSRSGYIKRLPPATFKSQHRGGKGLIGAEVAEEDFLDYFITANTHDNILFFTERGRVFQTKVYEIPTASRISKGKGIHNFLEIPMEEKISAIVAYSAKDAKGYLVMVTKNGLIKKTNLEDFANVRRNGIIALSLRKDDQLKWVKLSSGSDEIILTTTKGQAIRFKESQVRPMGRLAAGVIAVREKKDDAVASMDVILKDLKNARYLVIMERGYGKQTPLTQYKVQSRGGSGIKTANITQKTGGIVLSCILSDGAEDEDLIVISQKGQVIRTVTKSISVLGRATQGIRIMKLDSGDKVASGACFKE